MITGGPEREPDTTDLWELLEWRARLTPRAEALVDRMGRRVTFAGLRDRSEAMAAHLRALGITETDTVAWQFPTSIEAVELTLALYRIGAIQIPIIGIYRDLEVTHCCRETKASWLITTDMYKGFDFAKMGALVTSKLELTHLTLTSDTLPHAAAIPGATKLSPDTPRWIFYTSGTTAVPKGARHTDQSLASAAAGLVGAMRLQATNRYALVFPLPHIGGIILLFAAFRAGCTHLLDDAFDPATSPQFLAREGVTHAGTGTPFHFAYLAAQRAHPTQRLFARLKCCPGGAAPKPPTLHAQVRDELGGVGIISSWGLTEAPCSHFDDSDEHLASTEGRPLPGVELRTVTGNGSLATSGEEGELQVRAPQVTVGYVDNRLDTDAFTEGWFRTGDLGVIDTGGYVRITGRLKDVIIRNGENISAKEVEDLLFTHPAVADVAVFGIPNECTGERVCASIVTASGAGPLQFSDMVSFLRDRGLRSQAIPEQLEHAAALPRNPAGKIIKHELRIHSQRAGLGSHHVATPTS
jgi:cyclohexanecarboxylate-CoA ligase